MENLIHELRRDFEVRIQCDKSELEVYPYEAIIEFIHESVNICVKEINALRNNKKGVNPDIYYAESRY